VAEVFAGAVVGFALSIIVAPAIAIALVRSDQERGIARQIAPAGTNVVALSIVLHLFAVLVLAAIGIVLGLALYGIEERRPDGGLGSPNLVFTILVVALIAAIVIPVLVLPAARRPVLVAALVAVIAFGWIMPWLATFG
jgi:heme/copper-type cytochrome/quinol oxidase subunit 4